MAAETGSRSAFFEASLLSRQTSLSELYKFGDVVVPADEESAGLSRFPHLNPDQYLVACEEANHIPPFLFDKTVDLLYRWPKPTYDADTNEDVGQYVAYILRRGRISPSVLTCTLIFMTRGKELLSEEKLKLSHCPWRRVHLFSAALVIAGKILLDQPFTMRSWAKVCRLPLDELRQLEVQFLQIIDNNLSLDPEDVRKYFSAEMQPPNLVQTRTMSRRDIQRMLSDDIDRLGLQDSVP